MTEWLRRGALTTSHIAGQPWRWPHLPPISFPSVGSMEMYHDPKEARYRDFYDMTSNVCQQVMFWILLTFKYPFLFPAGLSSGQIPPTNVDSYPFDSSLLDQCNGYRVDSPLKVMVKWWPWFFTLGYPITRRLGRSPTGPALSVCTRGDE